MGDQVKHTITPLEHTRKRQKLSYRELAHFTGISHTTISRLEKGDLDVSPAIKARLARALRVSVHELWPEAMEGGDE